MSEQRVERQYISSTTDYAEDAPTAWVGWVLFAGVMMILLGTFAVIEGLVGIFDHSYYHVRDTALVVHVNYTAWGWTHLALGVLALIGGFSLMVGRTWARVYAVILAMINATVNLAFLAANPVWSTIMITIDALVIYAVCVHGREVRNVSA